MHWSAGLVASTPCAPLTGRQLYVLLRNFMGVHARDLAISRAIEPHFKPVRPTTGRRVSGDTPMTVLGEDVELIRRIAALDQLALRTLIGRHQVRLYRFLMRLVRDETQAEELTNEVFMEVWRNAGRYEGRSQVGTWLLSIGRNRAISRMRKRRELGWDEDAAAEIADEDDDPEVTLQKRDKASLLKKCLSTLSMEHREIVDLVYYQEKSVSEVAEIVGIPENTVKTRLFYARKKLSELMLAQGIDRGWP